MGVKIAVVGGGSTYTPELVEGFARRHARLPIDELVLLDIDPERLAVVGGLARRMLDRLDWGGRLVLSGDREAAIDGADFVLIQLRVGGQAARLTDETLPPTFGVVGQETTGAGGLAKALRTVPLVLELAELTGRRAAPGAWIVDFTNPVGIVTQALIDGGHRAIGLCNVAINIQRNLAEHFGVTPDRVELEHVGLNHLSWERAVRVDGVDRLPELLGADPGWIAEHVGMPAELVCALGAIPSYYLRYYYETARVVEEQRSGHTRAQDVIDIEARLLDLYRDETLTEKPALLGRSRRGVLQRGGGATDRVAPRRAGDLQVVDVRNDGALPDLPDSAVVEIPARIDRDGAHPVALRPLAPEMRGLVQAVKAYEELAVAAAISGDRRTALRAMVANPTRRLGGRRAAPRCAARGEPAVPAALLRLTRLRQVRSGSRQALDHRRQLVDLAEHERRDPQASPQALDLVDECVDRADEQVRRLEDLVDGQLDAGPRPQVVDDPARLGPGVIGHDDLPARRVDVELEPIETVAGCLAHPGDLLLGRRDGEAARLDPLTGQLARRETDDVGLASGQAQGPPSASADQQRRVRPLDGLRLAVMVGDRVVPPLERERAVAEQTLEHRDRLGQPLDARRHWLEWQADGVVLGPVPAGADADVEAPAAQHVEAGHVLGEDRRVAQVVVGHERADPERLGRGGDHGHRRDRRELLDQVIRDDQCGEADRFGAPGGGGQRGAVDDGLEGGQESEWSRGFVHGPMVAGAMAVEGFAIRVVPWSRDHQARPLRHPRRHVRGDRLTGRDRRLLGRQRGAFALERAHRHPRRAGSR